MVRDASTGPDKRQGTKARRRGVFVVAMGVLVLGCAVRAHAEDWRGWRGVEHQGVSASKDLPTGWSQEKGVRWKTPVPGRAYSSPVVSGDNVIVTTAYRARGNQAAKTVARIAILTLSACLAVWALGYVVRSCRKQPKLTKLQALGGLAFFFVLGILLLFVTGSAVTPAGEWHAHGRHNWWLTSALVFCLCLVLGVFQLPRRSRARLLVGVIALLFCWLFIAQRPFQEYWPMFASKAEVASTDGGASPGEIEIGVAGPGRGAMKIVVLLVVIGAAAVLLTRFGRRPSAEEASPAPESPSSGGGATRRVALAVLGLVLGGLIPPLSLGGLRAIRSWRASGAIDLSGVSINLLDHHLCWMLVYAAVLLWLAVGAFDLWKTQPRISGWFSVAILLLGGLAFIERNVLVDRRDFTRAIVCLDRKDGRVKWTCEALRGPQAVIGQLNSQASPTPFVEGGRVYAYFGPSGAMCADLEGKLLWTNTDLPLEAKHGAAASPMAYDGLVVIVAGQPKAPYVTALDGKTGQRVWTVRRAAWEYLHEEHGTPTIVTVGGKGILLVWGWFDLKAYDVRTGQELGTYRFPKPQIRSTGEVIASLIQDGDRLYLPHESEMRAISLSKLVGGQDPLLWAQRMRGKGPNVSSPVLRKGMLFMVSDSGHVTCLDAQTGDRIWREKLRGAHMASVVAAGDSILFINTAGVSTIVACDKEFRKIAENDLKEPVHSSPAVVDGEIIVRTTKHVWCIR